MCFPSIGNAIHAWKHRNCSLQESCLPLKFIRVSWTCRGRITLNTLAPIVLYGDHIFHYFKRSKWSTRYLLISDAASDGVFVSGFCCTCISNTCIKRSRLFLYRPLFDKRCGAFVWISVVLTINILVFAVLSDIFYKQLTEVEISDPIHFCRSRDRTASCV